MFGLPQSTDIHKMLLKKLIYDHFALSAQDKEKFDDDISKLYITNEISAATIAVTPGANVTSIFVISVELKKRNYAEKNIQRIATLIPQNIIFALHHRSDVQLAVYRTRFLRTGWKTEADTKLPLDRLTLDTISQNIIVYISGITLEPQRTLDEQIQFDTEQEKRTAEIERLEKLARKETQPRKKLELFEKIQELKRAGNRIE